MGGGVNDGLECLPPFFLRDLSQDSGAEGSELGRFEVEDVEGERGEAEAIEVEFVWRRVMDVPLDVDEVALGRKAELEGVGLEIESEGRFREDDFFDIIISEDGSGEGLRGVQAGERKGAGFVVVGDAVGLVLNLKNFGAERQGEQGEKAKNHGLFLLHGLPLFFREPLVDHVVTAADISGDAIFRLTKGVCFALVLIDDAFCGSAGGVDEAEFAVFTDDDEGDMAVEPHDVDSGPMGFEFLKKAIVAQPRFDMHLMAREEGADDILRGLLGEVDALDLETGITHDCGNEVATSDLSFAGDLRGAIEVPLSAKPATHHFRQGGFEGLFGFVTDILNLARSASGCVAVSETGALEFKFLLENLVALGVRHGLGFSDCADFSISRHQLITKPPSSVGKACGDQEKEEALHFSSITTENGGLVHPSPVTPYFKIREWCAE